jgi:hypothetical protein
VMFFFFVFLFFLRFFVFNYLSEIISFVWNRCAMVWRFSFFLVLIRLVSREERETPRAVSVENSVHLSVDVCAWLPPGFPEICFSSRFKVKVLFCICFCFEEKLARLPKGNVSWSRMPVSSGLLSALWKCFLLPVFASICSIMEKFQG